MARRVKVLQIERVVPNLVDGTSRERRLTDFELNDKDKVLVGCRTCPPFDSDDVITEVGMTAKEQAPA